jgi:hypothetical protein
VAEHVCVLRHVGLKAAAPDSERGGHARVERPRARIVGLVLIETHDAAGQIHVAPVQVGRFLPPHPLSLENPEKEPSDQGHRPTRAIKFASSAGQRHVKAFVVLTRGNHPRGIGFSRMCRAG